MSWIRPADGADGPDAGIRVTIPEDLCVRASRTNSHDVPELTTVLEDLDHLARYRVADTTRAVLCRLRKICSVPSSLPSTMAGLMFW